MFKKITQALMALTVAFGLAVTSAPQAEAGHRGVGVGIAAGIIGLGILGAAANAGHYGHHSYYSAYDDDRSCYRGPRECHWTGRRCFENRWGDEVCRGGRYVCERQVICE
jgi:hypothetical protein